MSIVLNEIQTEFLDKARKKLMKITTILSVLFWILMFYYIFTNNMEGVKIVFASWFSFLLGVMLVLSVLSITGNDGRKL